MFTELKSRGFFAVLLNLFLCTVESSALLVQEDSNLGCVCPDPDNRLYEPRWTNDINYNKPNYEPEVKDCAGENETFCTNNTRYPHKDVERLLKENPKIAESFITDTLRDGIALRGIIGGENLCESVEDVVYVDSAQTLCGRQFFIMQTANHKQGVRVSKCRGSGQECKFSNTFPNGYRSECKQEMFYRELYILSPTGEMVTEKFPFPSGCSCYIKKIF